MSSDNFDLVTFKVLHLKRAYIVLYGEAPEMIITMSEEFADKIRQEIEGTIGLVRDNKINRSSFLGFPLKIVKNYFRDFTIEIPSINKTYGIKQ